MAGRVLADTSALLALAHRQDRDHARAVTIARRFLASGGRFVATPLILAELQALLLYRRGPEVARGVTTALLEDPAYQWLAADAEVLAAAGGWLERFRDQRLTLCDGVSFESMRRERIKSAFAFDQHFELAGFKVLVA